MKIEESLTKENFWNEIEQKYPNAFKVFCDWIDKYFDTLEYNLFLWDKNELEHYPIDKIQELPHAMQLGIWFTFIKEKGGYSDIYNQTLSEEIDYWMQMHEIEML